MRSTFRKERAVRSHRTSQAIAGRGFAVATTTFAVLAVLAVGVDADGKDEEHAERSAGRVSLAKTGAVTPASQEMERLRKALAPLLIYVENGQPREALRALAGISGTGEASPAALSGIYDSMREAAANVGGSEAAGSRAQGKRVQVAVGLYVEATGLAKRAAERESSSEGNTELAEHGLDLLRLGDALFDQTRRLDRSAEASAPPDYLDEPEAVPDLASIPGAGTDLSGRTVPTDIVETASRCLSGVAEAPSQNSACADQLFIAAAAEETLRRVGGEGAVGKRLALKIWMEAGSLARHASRFEVGDLGLPDRLLSMARTVFELAPSSHTESS